jgi:hypothetical protein
MPHVLTLSGKTKGKARPPGFTHEVIRFPRKETDFEWGCREGKRSAILQESPCAAQQNMVILAIGYADPALFMRGFSQGYKASQVREEWR